MNFVDWFNPSDFEHVKAYKHLCDTGCWPAGFKPANLTMTPGWQMTISAKLADRWVAYMLTHRETDSERFAREESESDSPAPDGFQLVRGIPPGNLVMLCGEPTRTFPPEGNGTFLDECNYGIQEPT